MRTVPDAYSQCMYQLLTRMLRISISFWCVCSTCFRELNSVETLVPDAYAQCRHQFLTRMFSARISSWRTRSECVWVPDPYAQRSHKGRIMRARHSIFSMIFKALKTAKIFKNSYTVDINKWYQKLHKQIFCSNSKKSLLKIWLSTRVWTFAAPNRPLNTLKFLFYFNPKVTLS